MPDSFRVRFPADEGLNPWLPILLDAYEVFDRGISLALQREKRKRGRRPACTEGCDNCCTNQTDIPVYPLEMTGIYWYVLEKTGETVRARLKNTLEAPTPGGPCPFLRDRLCAIYPVRPAACRQFIVYGRPCGEGEDPFFSRREDVLTPIQEAVDQAFYIMMPFYGITKEEEKTAAIKNKIIHVRAKNLMTTDWKALADRITKSSR